MEITFIPSFSEMLHAGVSLDSILRTSWRGNAHPSYHRVRPPGCCPGQFTVVMGVVGIGVSVTMGMIVVTGTPKRFGGRDGRNIYNGDR